MGAHVFVSRSLPFAALVLALLAISGLRAAGRSIAIVAWLFAFLFPVLAAPRARRLHALAAALASLGVLFLARNAPAATPDTLAAALAALGLVRIARAGRVDAISATILVVVPFVKPSSLGIVAGACVVHVVHLARQRVRGFDSIAPVIAGASAVAVLIVGCEISSGGAWLSHLVRSTGQPLTLTRFVQELGARILVLGAPHAGRLELSAYSDLLRPVVATTFVRDAVIGPFVVFRRRDAR